MFFSTLRKNTRSGWNHSYNDYLVFKFTVYIFKSFNLGLPWIQFEGGQTALTAFLHGPSTQWLMLWKQTLTHDYKNATFSPVYPWESTAEHRERKCMWANACEQLKKEQKTMNLIFTWARNEVQNYCTLNVVTYLVWLVVSPCEVQFGGDRS